MNCEVCESTFFGLSHVSAHPAFKMLPECTCKNHILVPKDKVVPILRRLNGAINDTVKAGAKLP